LANYQQKIELNTKLVCLQKQDPRTLFSKYVLYAFTLLFEAKMPRTRNIKQTNDKKRDLTEILDLKAHLQLQLIAIFQ